MKTPRLTRFGLVCAASLALVGASLQPASADPTAFESLVVIDKTWLSPPAPPVANGTVVTARLTAFNGTPSTKTIMIRDTYDVGLAPGALPGGCVALAAPARVIECTSSVGAGLTSQFDIPYTVTYQGPKRYTRNWKSDERVTVMKEDKHWNLYGGETQTFKLRCPTGYTILDPQLHKQSVDQDQGTLEDLHVDVSELTATTWDVTLHNDTGGQAQGKLWSTCLKNATNMPGQSIGFSGVQDDTWTKSFVGEVPTEFHASCAAGETPVALNLKATQPTWWQDELYTQIGLYSNGGPSAVFFAIVHRTGTFTLQWYCMSTTSTSGKRLDLRVDDDTYTVPANTQQDFTTTCDDDEKGIIGGWQGLGNLQKFHTYMNGQEPRPKLRTYWMRNLTASPLKYDTKLLCVGNRLVRGGKIDPVAVDTRCNYADGLVAGPPDFWTNWKEVCLTVRQS